MKKLTSPTEVGGQKIHASVDNPRYPAESEKSGKEVAHKPDVPSKVSEVRVPENRKQVIADFHEVVNMTPKELEEWLETEESQSVGQSEGGDESKGHESGGKIVEILRRNKSDYTDEDIDHMERVASYVHRHQAQKPNSEVENSNWRYSLLNWGHDPLK